MKKKTSSRRIILIHAINLSFLLIVMWILFRDFAFTSIFLLFVLGSQLAFWGIIKLRDDKKWVGSYSFVAIGMILSALYPFYLGLYIFFHYSEVNTLLLQTGFSGLGQVAAMSLGL